MKKTAQPTIIRTEEPAVELLPAPPITLCK